MSSLPPSSIQRAAVLYCPKDLRVDVRALWPLQQGQAQVASTGLCGSDRTLLSSVGPGRPLTSPSAQHTIISTAVTVIFPFNRP